MVAAFQGYPTLMGGDFDETLEAKDRPRLRRFLNIHRRIRVIRNGASGLQVHMEEHEW